jgi:RHS repeat-associated protein
VGLELVVNNVRFPGQYFDDETGLHYNWHRFYDPETGRYISADPIGLDGGVNLYAYVSNDPVNWIDPLGLFEYYGRWGGPNWTGGYNTSWDKLTPYQRQQALTDPKRIPQDAQDKCYQSHDICYGTSREKCADDPCPGQCEKEELNKCDSELSSCLVGCGMMPDAIDEVHRLIAIPTFHLQPAYRKRGFSENGSYYQLRFDF